MPHPNEIFVEAKNLIQSPEPDFPAIEKCFRMLQVYPDGFAFAGQQAEIIV